MVKVKAEETETVCFFAQEKDKRLQLNKRLFRRNKSFGYLEEEKHQLETLLFCFWCWTISSPSSLTMTTSFNNPKTKSVKGSSENCLYEISRRWTKKTKYLAFLGFVVSHCCFVLVYLFVLDLSTHSIEKCGTKFGAFSWITVDKKELASFFVPPSLNLRQKLMRAKTELDQDLMVLSKMGLIWETLSPKRDKRQDFFCSWFVISREVLKRQTVSWSSQRQWGRFWREREKQKWFEERERVCVIKLSTWSCLLLLLLRLRKRERERERENVSLVLSETAK